MKPKILLVDDDRPVLFLMTAIFRRAEYDVVAVLSAKEAIARLEQERFNVVITDYFLGDQTGEDVVAAVRQKQPGLKVIVVTGDVQRLPDNFGNCADVARVISKPFQLVDLLDAARDAILSGGGEAGLAERSRAEQQSAILLPKGVEEMVHRVVDQESIVAITDKKGTIVYANDRFCEISGYSRSELLGQNHRLLKSGQHPPAFYKNLWGTILNGRVWRGEICNRAKDGRLYYVDTTISPLRDEGLITHFIALRTDITARKEVEATLSEQRKREEDDRRMAALGRMANGFLHDLNNILTGVMGLATETGSAERDTLLYDAIGRMVQLTRTLRDFTTGQPILPETFLLNPLLKCACSLVRHRKGAPRALTITEQIAATREIEVTGNEGQVFEVVLNLIVNAMEASADLPHPHVVLRAEVNGTNVVIQVEDNGPGVPAALAKNIFEPFTTTKGDGRGIGLSVSKSIALAHRGDLSLERIGGDDTGACFQLTLPASVAKGSRAKEQEIPVGPKRVVLLSEDEAEVRRVIARDAAQIGLTVMNAVDVPDMLALASQMKEVLAAAIIDSCEIDSEQGAVACLRRLSPDLPIFLISAHLGGRGRTTTPWGEVEKIPKPFVSDELIKAVSAALK
ncbi:MAG: response regulator [Verrucomicrobia bacterium]|nr:response regulator [Verrucomicrobiota bacterium]